MSKISLLMVIILLISGLTVFADTPDEWDSLPDAPVRRVWHSAVKTHVRSS